MPQLLEILKAEAKGALSKGSLILFGAGAFGVAVIFIAAAIAAGLALIMPLYVALLCSAALLLVVGAACAGAAGARKPRPPALRAEVPQQPFHLSDVTYRVVEEELRRRPGKSAAAAVVAGFVLGALDALDKHNTPE